MLKNCLARIGCLTLLALAAGAGWLFRDEVGAWWNRLESARFVEEPSEAAALEAERKIRRLWEARPPVTVRLSEPELQSLVLFRVGPDLPDGIERPAVEIRDSTMVLTALLRLDRMVGVPGAEMLRTFLSDSATFTVELSPRVERPGEARVDVLALQAGSVAVPSMMVPALLGQLELPDARAEGRGLVFPVPAQLAAIRVFPGALELSTAP